MTIGRSIGSLSTASWAAPSIWGLGGASGKTCIIPSIPIILVSALILTVVTTTMIIILNISSVVKTTPEVPALTGPDDPRWQGAGTLVEDVGEGVCHIST